MFSLFFTTVGAKRPIILIPGLMGSVLNGNITKKRYWFCSKEKNGNVWFNDKYAIPPTYKCAIDAVRLEWDSVKKEPKQPDYISLETVDFGGINGVTNVDKAIFGIHLVPYYKYTIEKLENIGYIVGKDLFGAPFDWRFGVYQTPEFWDKLTKLVEKAYNQNNQKVVIAGHSMGGFLTNVFLTQKTTPEWRAKYVDSGIYLAPSFGGSGPAYNSIYTRKMPLLDVLGEFEEAASIGGVHVHMPNHEIFGDKVMSIGKNGENLTAKDLTKYLLDTGKLEGDNYEIFKKNEPNFQHAPKGPDVPSLVIYNSRFPTANGMDYSKEKPEVLYGTGDGLVNTEGPKYACDHWPNTKCLDIFSANPIDNHLSMLYRDSVNNELISWLLRE